MFIILFFQPIQKAYDLPGPANPTAKPLRMIAAEVMAYFKALNYDVTAADEVITFRGDFPLFLNNFLKNNF